MVTRDQVVATARTWLDTEYKHQHRVKGHFVDCAGLVIGVARELGLCAPDFDVTGYSPTPDGTSLIAECDRWMDRVPMHSLQPGDVVVLKFGDLPHVKPQHMGIVGDYKHGGLSLIQALGMPGGGGRVIEWKLHERKGWKNVQGYALRGVV